MALFPEDVRTLVDIGMIAWSRGHLSEAGKIFEALRLDRPEEEACAIGGALVAMSEHHTTRAIAMLRRIPPTDTARAFLGIALLDHGERQEGAEMLEEVAKSAGESAPGSLARAALDINSFAQRL